MKKFVVFLIIGIHLVSCEEIIEITDISSEHVTVLAPLDNTTLTSKSVTFTWEAMEEVEGYHLQIATPSFANALQIVKDSTLTTTNFLTTLDFNDYEWRIRAENSGYTTVYITQRFSIEE